MADYWEPLAYIAVQGLLMGLVVGFAVRKLNKVIAAVVGFSLMAINVVWFMRMLGIDLAIPALNSFADSLIALLPFSPQEALSELGPQIPVLSSIPFVGGFLVGLWGGFKLA